MIQTLIPTLLKHGEATMSVHTFHFKTEGYMAASKLRQLRDELREHTPVLLTDGEDRPIYHTTLDDIDAIIRIGREIAACGERMEDAAR